MTNVTNIDNIELLFDLILKGLKTDCDFLNSTIDMLDRYLITHYYQTNESDELYVEIVKLIAELKTINPKE